MSRDSGIQRPRSTPRQWQGPPAFAWRPDSDWDTRHNVTDSKDNQKRVGAKRCLFDNLLGLRVRGGVYVDTCSTHQAKIFDTSSATCADELLRRAQGKVQRCPFFPETWAAQAMMRASEIRKAMEADSRRNDSDIFAGRQHFLQHCSSPSGRARTPRAKNPKKLAREHLDNVIAFAQAPGQEPYLRFLLWVRSKYGNLQRVWRLMDKDESMVVSKSELIGGLRGLGYKGTTKEYEALWSTLDRDTTGVVRYLHFDPITAGALTTLRHWCTLSGGSVREMATIFDEDRSGSISVEEFESGCRNRGFFQDEALQLLFLLMGMGRQDQLSPNSLGFFERWDAPEFMWAEPDPDGARDFKEFLFERHKHNPIRAWRKSLDKDSSMRVCWMEFKKTVQLMKERYPKELGFVSIAGIWRELDPMISGWITLRDFDVDAYNIIAAYVSWAKREHGSVSRSFNKMLPGAAAEKGLGRGKIAKLLCGPLNMSEDQMDLLFDGLNLEEGDRVSLSEIKFLENWDPVTEAEEKKSWAKHFAKLRHYSAAMVNYSRGEEG